MNWKCIQKFIAQKGAANGGDFFDGFKPFHRMVALPALDGGRLVFLGYELVTRRRANPRIETMVHMVGILFLMVVMVLVTWKDVARLF